MKSTKVLLVALLFLVSSTFPLINVNAADEERRDTDTNYLSEAWRSGLGTNVGSLNSINNQLFSEKTLPYELDKSPIDIDSYEDLNYANFLAAQD